MKKTHKLKFEIIIETTDGPENGKMLGVVLMDKLDATLATIEVRHITFIGEV